MNRLREESGFTLVEVLVSILILSIAIIPMAAMFDTALKTAVTGSNYEKARSLANGKLEEVKSLPFYDENITADAVSDSLIEKYPPNGETKFGGSVSNGNTSCNTGIFTCNVRTVYVREKNSGGIGGEDYSTAVTSRTFWIRATVTVSWSGGSFTTSGLVARDI